MYVNSLSSWHMESTHILLNILYEKCTVNCSWTDTSDTNCTQSRSSGLMSSPRDAGPRHTENGIGWRGQKSCPPEDW
jgi:hypothetical protein